MKKRRQRQRKIRALDMERAVVVDVELRREGTGKGGTRMATVAVNQRNSGAGGGAIRSPALGIGAAIRDALDPAKAPSVGRSFADMSPEEREAIKALYERKS